MTGAGGRHEGVAAAKDRLRRDLLARRRALTPEQIARARVAVATAVLTGLRPDDRVVAAYEALRTEPGSTALLQALVDSGREVLVPLTQPDRDLDWVRWTPAGTGASLGLAAVARADVVLVPALAVARRDGGRLGRGGGSYDRALVRARGRLVALLHDGELLDDVPTDDHDRPVDAAATPSGWHEVRGRGPGREGSPEPSR